MNAQQLYTLYSVPPNLQKHMLRVASLSQIIGEKWLSKNLDIISVSFTCLFHDMANIIKFDFNKPPLFKEEANQDLYWKQVQKEVIQKYGANVHDATLKICHEIGLSNKILNLVAKLEWNNSLNVIQQNDFESALCIYCDMRIGPYGILSLQDRLKNLQTRNSSFDYKFIEKSAIILEKKIQKNISISVNSITDTHLNERFEKLLEISV